MIRKVFAGALLVLALVCGTTVVDAQRRNIDRLERREHAIDSIAIEVERITEGQRFTTKLLSEGRGASESRQVSPGGSAHDRST